MRLQHNRGTNRKSSKSRRVTDGRRRCPALCAAPGVKEAAVHLKHALDLRPDFEPALAALKDIENIPEASVHVYTLLIIICLGLGSVENFKVLGHEDNQQSKSRYVWGY
ncbi:hypothetical protein EVAR_102818_1 [Eumeta japonica]|uniref:Uncharacterized protein n=1 Tax=Eumeta variegata TaxID=151549 RepID=A0A4C1TI10_EUMVA|nr:hypothetical protein EVAR_102818_1 [Eumeta japonica]